MYACTCVCTHMHTSLSVPVQVMVLHFVNSIPVLLNLCIQSSYYRTEGNFRRVQFHGWPISTIVLVSFGGHAHLHPLCTEFGTTLVTACLCHPRLNFKTSWISYVPTLYPDLHCTRACTVTYNLWWWWSVCVFEKRKIMVTWASSTDHPVH